MRGCRVPCDLVAAACCGGAGGPRSARGGAGVVVDTSLAGSCGLDMREPGRARAGAAGGAWRAGRARGRRASRKRRGSGASMSCNRMPARFALAADGDADGFRHSTVKTRVRDKTQSLDKLC